MFSCLFIVSSGLRIPGLRFARFALPPRPAGTPPKEGNGLLKGPTLRLSPYVGLIALRAFCLFEAGPTLRSFVAYVGLIALRAFCLFEAA